KNKEGVGMKIPSWMITDEMKLTENYWIQNDPDTSLDPESYKKSPEVEKTVVVSQPVNVIKEEDESTKDDYEFRRREKGKNVEESRHTPSLTTIRYPRIHSTLVSLDTEKL
nr:hypothetical protein [Tanacetum cinerariifolium]